VILGLSMGLALAMLVAHQAVGEKIASVQASVGNTVSISPAGVRGFEGGGDALTGTQLAAIPKLAHVSGVNEELNDRLTTSNSNLQSAVDAGNLGRRFSQNNGTSIGGSGDRMIGGADGEVRSFTPPVTVRGTTDPSNMPSTQGGGTFTLKSGKVFASNSAENVAVLGSSLATKNNLAVGSTFTAYGQTITVVGIFDAGNSFANNQVVMPLKSVQTLSAQSDAITSATVQVDSITNIDSVTMAVKTALGDKADVTNEAAAAKESIAPLHNIQTISLYSLVGAVIAGAAIILLTMVMIVRERRREIGVLKAIGASNIKIMTQFMAEATTLTSLGAVIGIGLGVAAGSPITKLLVNNSTSDVASTGGRMMGGGLGGGGRAFRGLHNSVTSIQTSVGWDIILYGLGAAVIIALVGSALASFFIAKIRPAEVMRAE
jgi:putative ABC transport system permease protein